MQGCKRQIGFAPSGALLTLRRADRGERPLVPELSADREKVMAMRTKKATRAIPSVKEMEGIIDKLHKIVWNGQETPHNRLKAVSVLNNLLSLHKTPTPLPSANWSERERAILHVHALSPDEEKAEAADEKTN